MLPSNSEALRNLSTWREPQLPNRPVWSELGSEAVLPPNWREEWRWPLVSSDDRRDLVATLARFLIPGGILVGNEMLSKTGFDEETFTGTEDQFDDEARHFFLRLFGSRNNEDDQAAVVVFSHGLTVDREDSITRRLFFGMKGSGTLLHLGATNQQFKELTGSGILLMKNKLFAIDGGLIAEAFPCPQGEDPVGAPASDVDIYIRPQVTQ